MKGTMKQIKWAEDIKQSWTETRKARLIEAISPKVKPEFISKLIETVDRIETIEDASWWIDNRVAIECHSGNYKDVNLGLALGLIPEAAKKLGMA